MKWFCILMFHVQIVSRETSCQYIDRSSALLWLECTLLEYFVFSTFWVWPNGYDGISLCNTFSASFSHLFLHTGCQPVDIFNYKWIGFGNDGGDISVLLFRCRFHRTYGNFFLFNYSYVRNLTRNYQNILMRKNVYNVQVHVPTTYTQEVNVIFLNR